MAPTLIAAVLFVGSSKAASARFGDTDSLFVQRGPCRCRRYSRCRHRSSSGSSQELWVTGQEDSGGKRRRKWGTKTRFLFSSLPLTALPHFMGFPRKPRRWAKTGGTERRSAAEPPQPQAARVICGCHRQRFSPGSAASSDWRLVGGATTSGWASSAGAACRHTTPSSNRKRRAIPAVGPSPRPSWAQGH